MTLRKDYALSTIGLSLARLIATIVIYIFHYMRLLGYSGYRLDFYAILAFCFLSGYFIRINKADKYKWIIKRYLAIMIPYWLVIFPIVVLNQLFNYKENLSASEYIVTIIGGNMFLDNPIYVIAWYVTFIIILYGYAFIESFCETWSMKIIAMASALLLFIYLEKWCYFLVFLIGLRMSTLCPIGWPKESDRLWIAIASTLFVSQKYCYSFFLVHGAVLLFFCHTAFFSQVTIFFVSFVTTLMLSIVLCNISTSIISYVSKKMMRLPS